MKFPSTLKISVLPVAELMELEEKNKSQGSKVLISGETESELLRVLSAALKFKYQLLVPADMEWGRQLPDRQWTGMIGLVHRNEADLALSEISITEERLKVVDYTFPYNLERVTFATKSAKYTSVHATLLDPFANDIWFAVVLSLIIVSVIARYLIATGSSLQKILFKMAGGLLRIGPAYLHKRSSQRILLLSWGVGTMMLSYCYTSLLLSFLTFPLKQVNIDTGEQLVQALKSKQFKCVTVEPSSVFRTILDSQDESVQYISKLIVQNNWYIPFINSEIERAILEDNKAYIGLSSDIKRIRKHGIHTSTESFALDLTAIAVSKNFCCKDSLDHVIHCIASAGLFERIYKMLEFQLLLESSTGQENIGVSAWKTLELQNLHESFFLLIFGWIISAITFGFEILVDKFGKILNL